MPWSAGSAAREFAVRKAPEPKICKECDFKTFCYRQGTIKRVEG